MNKIIEILVNAKKEKGITLKELSEKSGVSLGTVNKLFSGGIASVKVQTALKLASVLGVSQEELLSLEESSNSVKSDKPRENYGFVKVAAITNDVKVCDVSYNVQTTIEQIDYCVQNGVSLAVFPELNICAYTAEDMLTQDLLLNACIDGMFKIADYTNGKNILVFVGLPVRKDSRLYNCAAAIANGEVLAIIPKKNLPNYNEFFEKRWFCVPEEENGTVTLNGKKIPFGYKIILVNEKMPNMRVACEICEDLWVPDSPSINHALNGANVVVNLSASNEVTGKNHYRKDMVVMQSSKCLCAYIYTSCGHGESSASGVFGAHNIISEAGRVISESAPFEGGIAIGDIDCSFLEYERSKKFKCLKPDSGYQFISYSALSCDFSLQRRFSQTPFVPESAERLSDRCESVLNIQAHALAKRMEHTGINKLVFGLSGGLDSTLALLVCERAMQITGNRIKDVIAITMPCFGTSGRTYKNSCELAKLIKCTLLEIDIKQSVTQHFKDIGHPDGDYGVVYENSQARERTQVLMDYANKIGGLVVGTGDMSELALGWATFNGDHMSMYSVNAGVPKTLVRAMVTYFAEKRGGRIKEILNDVVDTPVSPELKPIEGKENAQATELFVGPYELNDFFLYYLIKHGFAPSKVYYVAKHVFCDKYSAEDIAKWLENFIRRFFAQQFKRSCQPDSPKTGSLFLSPAAGLLMPSDTVSGLWLDDLRRAIANDIG